MSVNQKRPRFRVVLAIFILAMVFLPPIGIETFCRRMSRQQTVENADPLTINDAFYHRPETDTYLSYPEWLIIYAYSDLATMLRQSGENSYSYLQAIDDYWGGFCSMNRLASANGGGTLDQKATLYTAGISFTADMSVRGVYENTVGRLTAWWRGRDLSREDFFAHAVADSYSSFLRQHPWYDFPFGGALYTLWETIPFDRHNIVRAAERRFALTARWGIEGGAAWVARTAASMAPEDNTVGAVVQHLTLADIEADHRIVLVRHVRPDLALIRAPEASFTDIVGRLSLKHKKIVEISGNQTIMMTALTAPGVLQMPPGARIVFMQPIQSKPGLRRIGFDVRVPTMVDFIDQLLKQNVILEHIYNY
jgi:hypothetical protein